MLLGKVTFIEHRRPQPLRPQPAAGATEPTTSRGSAHRQPEPATVHKPSRPKPPPPAAGGGGETRPAAGRHSPGHRNLRPRGLRCQPSPLLPPPPVATASSARADLLCRLPPAAESPDAATSASH